MHMLHKLIISGLFMAIATASRADAPADTLAKIRATGEIALGHRDAAIPFSYLVDGKPLGYTVEMCQELVKRLQTRLALPALKIKWVTLSAAQRLPAVQSGEVDLECGNTTSTVKRREVVTFTVPTFIAGAGVLTRSELGAASLADLRGKRVAVAEGTTAERVVKRANEAQLALTPVIVKDNAAAFAALEQGQAEAWITDDILLAAYRAGAKDPKRFTLLSKRHTIEPLALTLRKNDQPFEQAVDAEMKALYREGRATALYRRWFMQAIAPKGVVLDVPPSRLLRETFRQPQKVEMDTDVVVL
jgi:ABC-type amino acid transport substrate-binding protein